MIELLNTRDVPVHKRFVYWREYLCNCNVLLSAYRDEDKTAPFSAEMRGAALHDVLFHTWKYQSPFKQDIITVDRTGQHMARDAYDAYILTYNNGHTKSACIQDGIETIVPPNCFCLYSSRPHRTLTRYDAEGMFVSIPRYHLQSLLANPDFRGARMVPADYGAARLLLAFCREIPRIKEELPYGVCEIMAHHFVSLVALAFEPCDKGLQQIEPTLTELRYREAVKYIDANLADPELSAASVAATLNISQGYLSRLLAEHNVSFHEYVRMNRVRKAALDLVNRELAGDSITTIAYRNGFNSTSHFSRCFRERYHMSPRDYRECNA